MNEALLIVSAVADIGLVLLAFSRTRAWLYASIAVNLILITVLGPKLIYIWGVATNIGNVYYAAVFFAIYLLLEHGSREHVLRALAIGVMSVVGFVVLLTIGLSMDSHPDTSALDGAMRVVFGNVPRFALASLAGFALAQLLNATLYLTSKEEPAQLHWWLRIIVVMMVAQLVDSIIFFTVAFWGSVATPLVIETLFTGYAVKVGIGILSVPLIHWSHRIKRPA